MNRLNTIATLYIFVFGFALLINNVYISSLLFILLGIAYPQIIIVELLTIPIVEGLMIVEQGLTISKVLVIFYILYFILMAFAKNYKWSFKGIGRALFFILILFVGFINVSFNDSVVNYAGGIAPIAFKVFLVNLPRVILFIILTIYLSNNKFNFTKDALTLLLKSSPFIILIILMAFLKNGQVNYWHQVQRITLASTDPNEFGSLIAAFVPYFLFLLTYYNRRKNYFKLFVLASLAVILYIILETESRGAILTFIFGIFITAYFLGWIKLSAKAFITIIFIVGFFALVINLGFLNLGGIYIRFSKSGGNLSEMTANRTILWLNAFNLIPNRPIIGYGASSFVPIYYNSKYVLLENIMHSIYVETLFRFGLLGVIGLFLLLKFVFRRRVLFDIKREKLLSLPFLSLFMLLFAGLSLSWLWKEIIWINLAICYSIIGNIERQKVRKLN